MVDRRKEFEPTSKERIPVVEVPKKVEAEPEVESWMERIERRFARVPNKTATPVDDSVVVQNQQAQQPPIVLPVTHQTMSAGKKGKVEEGVTWLVVWVVRQIKRLTSLGRRVRLADMPEVKE